MMVCAERMLSLRLAGAVALGILCISGVVAPAISAEPVTGKVALVIANASSGAAGAPGCSVVGSDVAAALERVGYDVVTAIDGTSIAMRGAIQKFTEKLADGEKLAFSYICGRAVAVEDRIFLLPSGIDTEGAFRLETQGVVVTAIVNAMNGGESTLLGDLNGIDEDRARKGVRERADAADVVMILSAGKDRGETLGRAFLAQLSQSGSEWIATAAVAQDLKQAGAIGAIVSMSSRSLQGTVLGNLGAGTDIAIVPVPQSRPVAVPDSAEPKKVKPTRTTGRTKARGHRTKKQTKPKSGFFEFFHTNRRVER